jgi:ribosome-binding protein aMBF1 (putative translation factor)
MAKTRHRAFGAWLRAQLGARGWAVGRLARALDAHPESVRRWADGSATPARVHVAGLAAALGMDEAAIRDALDRTDAEGST